MEKKYIFIILLVLTLTGCDVEYNLDIDDQLEINENINVIATNQTDINELAEFNLYIPINSHIDDYELLNKKSEKIKYYNQKKKNDTINFNYKFNKEEFEKSYFGNLAFEYVSATQTDEELVLFTSHDFLLFDTYENLDNVKITITSKYKLINTNADEVEKHKYTWNINRQNAKGKYISLTLNTSKQDLTLRERIENGDYLNIFTISILLFIVCFIAYKLLKKYSDSKNKI